jgi:hypothetical protein
VCIYISYQSALKDQLKQIRVLKPLAYCLLFFKTIRILTSTCTHSLVILFLSGGAQYRKKGYTGMFET